jgi:hypothetical protein
MAHKYKKTNPPQAVEFIGCADRTTDGQFLSAFVCG